MNLPARRPGLPAGPFLVVGLARSGIAAALALRERGERVVGTDARALPDAERALLAVAGVPVEAPDDGLALVDRVATVVKSPGVPQDAPVLVAARVAQREILGELEVAWRLLDHPFLAVTGSNGKTTTVELLGVMYRRAGRPARVAGNVGTALSSLLGRLEPDATVICEASSFQLEDATRFAPDIAVLLNLTPDHLDRHGSLAAYRAAKLRIFASQPESAVAVVPDDLELSDSGGHGRRVRFGSSAGADLMERDEALWWRGNRLLAVSDIRLRGAHNRQNAMAAAAAALSAGVGADGVVAGLEEFGGVAHRLEEVASRAGVTYVNDSKATNVASAVVGLESFAGGVHLILGGRAKGEPFSPLAGPVAAHCRAVYLIGEAAPALRDALEPSGVALHDCGDLERAVAAAREAARPGEVVLLSPACASYDQYQSFEQRGDHFRDMVSTLA